MYSNAVRGLLVVLVLSLGILVTAQNAVAQTNPRMVRQIRSELVTLPYYGVFDWLTYQVQNDGTVILQGQVVRPSTKSDAEGRVKDIDGVRGIVNQIEVLPNSPSDDRLRLALYRAIYGFNSPLFHYATQSVPSIHIIVDRGRVTLRGVAANKNDANLAYIRARGVPGSFNVSNELSIENEQPR